MNNNKAYLALSEVLIRFQKLHPKKIDLTLDRSRKVLEKIGNPHKQLKNISNIIGSKAKGSTSKFLKSIIEAHGYTCNLYESPHLQSITERVTLKDKNISEEYFTSLLLETEKVIKKYDLIVTQFEAISIAATIAFKENPADYFVCEAGLGYNGDYTRVLEDFNSPLCQVITPLAIEHVEFLGDTIEKIAHEKCGYLNKNTKIIIAKQTPKALKAIDFETKNNPSPKFIYGEDFQINIENNDKFTYQDNDSLMHLDSPSLIGDHQKFNCATAIAAAKNILPKLDVSKVNYGITHTENKGRLQKITKGKLLSYLSPSNSLWIDGGHEELSAIALTNWANKIKNRKIYLIFGMLNTKNPKDFLKHFVNIATAIKTISIPNQENSEDPKKLAKISNELGIKANSSVSIQDALRECSNEDENSLILITGSLYLMGEVLNLN
jgi:dihydrofolate synthase/folylpolyglutamate synthase